MKKITGNAMKYAAAAVAAIAGVAVMAAGATINGAGASFPAPVYTPWTYTYTKATGTQVNYQSVGSGAGIAQIKAKTVDFAGSDNPLKKEDLEKNGLVQFPMLMGGVVTVVNLPGVKPGELKLSGSVLADIYLGKIKKWDDAAIKALNPGVALPSLPVTTVHRSDGSGTTWIFTNYLSKVSEEWAKGPGCDKDVKWPGGIGGQKNPGVANSVMKTVGSIGYVEYTYAVEAKMAYTALQNKNGKFVNPSIETFTAAGASADWKSAPGFYMVLTEQPGDKTWPITGASYILLQKDQPDAEKAKEMFKYFEWCFSKEAAKTAAELNYVPMPDNVVSMIKEEWKKVTAGGQPVLK